MYMKKRQSIPVSLPMGLVKGLDNLVESGEFSSRSEVIRFGARLAVMLEERFHKRAENYAYDEIVQGLKRGLKDRAVA